MDVEALDADCCVGKAHVHVQHAHALLWKKFGQLKLFPVGVLDEVVLGLIAVAVPQPVQLQEHHELTKMLPEHVLGMLNVDMYFVHATVVVQGLHVHEQVGLPEPGPDVNSKMAVSPLILGHS